jgi:hypothetical protein
MYKLSRAELAEIGSIISGLRQASELHKKQADKLQAIYNKCLCEDKYSDEPTQLVISPNRPRRVEDDEMVTIIAMYAEGDDYGSVPNVQGSY